jgi:superfamily I DNA/RNA helicase
MQKHVIFGAPGCGKTTYLISVLEQLLERYEPSRIAFVSFTRKGSYEGRDRAIEKLGVTEKDLPYFKTIHAIAFKELDVSRRDMIDRRHYKEFSKAMGMNFLGFYTEDLVNNDDKYLFQLALDANNPTLAKQTLEGLDHNTYLFVKKNYAKFKASRAIMDFHDLLTEAKRRDVTLDIDAAIIDEAQDLTSLQWQVCNKLFRNAKEIYIAGDDDQAIYEWSGADVGEFLRVHKQATSVKILSHSYRLKPEILTLARRVSEQISIRVDKDFTPSEGLGNVTYHNAINEITLNSEETYYFLARNNYFLRRYKQHLMGLGVVFTYKQELSVDLTLYTAIKRYEGYRKQGAVAAIKSDTYLQLKLKKDVSEFGPWYDVMEIPLEESNYYRNLFKNKADVNKSAIHVDTIHGVKGGEADNVIVSLDITRSVNNAIQTPGAMDAELRVLYVAFTRAKKNLRIVHSSGALGYENWVDIKGV